MRLSLKEEILAALGLHGNWRIWEEHPQCISRRIRAASDLLHTLTVFAKYPVSENGTLHYVVANPENAASHLLCSYVLSIAEWGEWHEDTMEHTWGAIELVIDLHVSALRLKTEEEQQRHYQAGYEELRRRYPLQQPLFSLPRPA